MKLAMIGLGKMGANMVRRLVKDGHAVVAYDVSAEVADALAGELDNVTPAADLAAVIARLEGPRAVWLMVPHQFVDPSIDALLAAGLERGDLVIDGGNSNFKQSQARGTRLAEAGIHFVDCGTSGGVWGLENGYSLMVGGSDAAVALIEPALKSLAPAADTGWGHVGPVGAGHYVKMVHNGIEYGLMQAYAEGFEMMQSREELQLDLHQVAQIWQHGSVVRSWLLDLIAEALGDAAHMATLSDYVDDSGEGRWTVHDAIDNAVPTPVLALALQMRFRSRQDPSYAGKLLNAMRAGFGGHAIRPTDSSKD
ncbi:MAG: decarboxylating 6-phosphogluconate dehydrogenase [Gammaproteobacteria bacterium]|nr:decarboxylating 6-phosphogluconate dehydrogenase [Gammaproteobacteria bacterium]MDH3560018.1 decarboxylating 6-phosphogluconate dehydrogenase [Gammaproteobacteria bacterium]